MPTYKDYLLTKLSKRKNIRKVVVFGSQASGRAKKESDLDIMVIVDNSSTPFTKRYAEISSLLEPRICSIDLIVKTQNEYKKRLRLNDPFVSEIEKTGKIIYER